MEKEFLKINLKKKHLRGKLKFLKFKEEDTFIIYIPSLEISGYGETIEEAHELVKLSLNEFSYSLFQLNEGQIYSALSKLGWSKNKFFKKELTNLSQTTYDDIKKEFNLPDNIEIEKSLVEV